MTKCGPWISFNGLKCPCIGRMAEVCYVDMTDSEICIAADHVYWQFVYRYKLAEN